MKIICIMFMISPHTTEDNPENIKIYFVLPFAIPYFLALNMIYIFSNHQLDDPFDPLALNVFPG